MQPTHCGGKELTVLDWSASFQDSLGVSQDSGRQLS